MSDNMLWLQHFIDERIERALKPSGVIPNQVINGVTYDRFGRAVRAVASGGGAPFLAKYGITTAPSAISSGTTARINFDYTWDDLGSYVTTGASWRFTPTVAAWYEFDVQLKLEIAGDPTGGSQVQLQYWENVGSTSIIAMQWDANDFPASAVNRFIQCVHHEYMNVGETASFRISNGLGVNINLAGSTSGRKINTITIKKVS